MHGSTEALEKFNDNRPRNDGQFCAAHRIPSLKSPYFHTFSFSCTRYCVVVAAISLYRVQLIRRAIILARDDYDCEHKTKDMFFTSVGFALHVCVIASSVI